jgi:fructose-specific phosphotransferase system IIC component
MRKWLKGRRRVALVGAVAGMIAAAASLVLVRALLIPLGWDPIALIVIQASITALLTGLFFWLQGWASG